jgi:hypothetical protein
VRLRNGHRIANCIDQYMSRKWLLQIGRAACVHRFSPNRCTVMRGHEDHGGCRAHRLQSAPHLNAGYAAQMDVEDNTRRLACAIVVEKRLAAVVHLRGKMRRVQNTPESAQDTRIVVDDRNYFSLCWHLIASCAGANRSPAKSRSEASKMVMPQVPWGRYCPMVQ